MKCDDLHHRSHPVDWIMIFTTALVLLHLCRECQRWRNNMRLLRLISRHVHAGSLLLKQPIKVELAINGSLVETYRLQDADEQLLLGNLNQQHMSILHPKLLVDLSDWTSYVNKQDCKILVKDNCCMMMIETADIECTSSFSSSSSSQYDTIKVLDHVTALAWRPGQPLGVLVECPLRSFATLAASFLQGSHLMLDDHVQLVQLSSVDVRGEARRLFPSAISADSPARSLLSFCSGESGDTWRQSNESMASDTECDVSLTGSIADDDLECNTIDDILVTANDEVNDDSSAVDTGSDTVTQDDKITKSKSSERGKCKPPNVLIYCGQKDSQRQFSSIQKLMRLCLNEDRYTIYHLKHNQVSSIPWQENTQLLLVASERTYDKTDAEFLRYFQNGGAVVSFASDFDRLLTWRSRARQTPGVLQLKFDRWECTNVICGCHKYDSEESCLPGVTLKKVGVDIATNAAVMLQATHRQSGGSAFLTQVNLEKDALEMAISPEVFAALKQHNSIRLDILRYVFSTLGLDVEQAQVATLSPCFLFATHEDRKQNLLNSVKRRLQNGMLRSRRTQLQFIDMPADGTGENGVIPVITSVAGAALGACQFSFDTYQENLHTRTLGNVMVYAPVTMTTMNLIDSLLSYAPDDVGLIAVADRQQSGQGRSGNTWLSPVGCAMFSLHVRVHLQSRLGQHIAYLQHIVALSVIEAICTLPGYEDLDVRLKWPNDIYFGDTMKLGGVIVNSSITNNVIHANIGCGFNVSNSNPTVCVNDLVERYNDSMKTCLPRLSTEQLIGRSVSQLERLMDLFEMGGRSSFLQIYYGRWLHSNQMVRLNNERGPEVKIIGLDNHGYLSALATDGAIISVHPDGNSFDMMKNLIVPKMQ